MKTPKPRYFIVNADLNVALGPFTRLAEANDVLYRNPETTEGCVVLSGGFWMLGVEVYGNNPRLRKPTLTSGQNFLLHLGNEIIKARQAKA